MSRPLALWLGLIFTATVAGEPVAVRLTLDEAVERALAGSPRLGRLDSLVRAAEEGLRGARAERLPSFDVTVGYARHSNVPELAIPFAGGAPRTIFPDIPDNYRARLGATLPLLTGGRMEKGVVAATSEREAARSELDSASRDLVLETTAAYWSLVTARETARVVGEALASYEQHLADARNRADLGMADASEILAAEVERDRAELERLDAEAAAQVAEANLARLLALEPGARIEAVEPLDLPAPIEEDLGSLVVRALASRADRAGLLARVAAADARAEVERAGLRPQVALAAGYDYANPNRKVLPPEPDWKSTWDVGVTASLVLFDGGRTRARTARARALVEAARSGLEDLDRRIRLEVTERWLDAGTAHHVVEVAERALRAAEERRRILRDRYREGLSPSSDLLDAEAASLRAGLDRTRALARLRIARASLDRSVGR